MKYEERVISEDPRIVLMECGYLGDAFRSHVIGSGIGAFLLRGVVENHFHGGWTLELYPSAFGDYYRFCFGPKAPTTDEIAAVIKNRDVQCYMIPAEEFYRAKNLFPHRIHG